MVGMALDVRSFIIFRICLGIYILYDIWMIRLSPLFWWTSSDGGSSIITSIITMMITAIYGDTSFEIIDYNIGWYTAASSSTSSTSYLQKNDTPHQSWIHQIWFYRGSSNNIYQYTLFIVTSCMAIAYIFGRLYDNDNTKYSSSRNNICLQQHRNEIIISIRSTLYKLCFWLLVTSYQNQNMFFT